MFLSSVEISKFHHTLTTVVGNRSLDHRHRSLALYHFGYQGDRTCPILINFRNEHDKFGFFSNYLKIAKSLTLGKIRPNRAGGNKTRIYVQHDMSKIQYEVYKAAIKLKKDGDIKSVRLQQGGVDVVFSKNDQKATFASKKTLNDEAARIKKSK